LWRRPRPKLSCGAKERRKKKKINSIKYLQDILQGKQFHVFPSNKCKGKVVLVLN
jgi:hypothetical protein